MELNSLKCSSIQMVHSIEFKLCMYITGHRLKNPIDFGEHRKNSVFTGIQKITLLQLFSTAYGIKFFKVF